MNNFLHELSIPATIPELQFFNVPLTQIVVNDNETTEYKLVAALAPNAPIKFFVSGASDAYLNLSQSTFEIGVKVTKDDGTPLTDANKVSTENLLLHSLFSQVDIFLNGKLVSTTNQNYAYRAYLETLLNYGTDGKFSQMRVEGYFKDEGAKLDVVDPTDKTAPKGLQERSLMIENSNTWQLYGRLHSDVFH